MPIYEYACPECGHEFEKLVKMNAEPPPCPECGAEVRKKVSAAGFILKGGGWYKDHYGLKPSSDSKKGEAKSESKGGDSGSAGSGGSSGGSDAPAKAKAVAKAASSSGGGGDA